MNEIRSLYIGAESDLFLVIQTKEGHVGRVELYYRPEKGYLHTCFTNELARRLLNEMFCGKDRLKLLAAGFHPSEKVQRISWQNVNEKIIRTFLA